MNNCGTGCFTLCARGTCITVELESLYPETISLVSMIKKNFEELGV